MVGMDSGLRDYQQDMLVRLERAWHRHRSVLVQMPTGTGKTRLMAEVVRSSGGNVLVVAHRRELIAQIREALSSAGVGGDVRVESIQKLSRQADAGPWTPSLVIVDEAHHAPARTYRLLWERWPGARFLGLTATPCRLGGEGFTELFEVLLQSWDIQAFIDKGWLSDFEYVSASPDSLMLQRVGRLRRRGADGDYQVREMATVLDVPESIVHLYRTYEAFAHGRKGIEYAIDRGHALHIAEYYSGHGVRACVIDARTPSSERSRLVEDYREGRVDVLVNVDIFSEGFDCPEVEFIQLARPTLSLSKYLQQVGRGMRVSAGKECVLILDMVGLYQTFGLPTDGRDWQQMFLGSVAGRGLPGMERPVMVREADDNKTLVNLKMVRIKRRNERHEGIEVFVLGGKYGVMVDGRVTCPAEFEHIQRLEAPYFALGVYPYYLYKNKTTVIDQQGRDMKAALYGRVERDGDFFCGETLAGDRQYWDAVGRRYYRRKPEVERMGRFEMVKTGSEYMLRQQSQKLNFPFRKEEVLVGQNLTIIRDMVIVRRDLNVVYKVFGYGYDTLWVESRNGCDRYQSMSNDGCLSGGYNKVPGWATAKPNLAALGLKRVV